MLTSLRIENFKAWKDTGKIRLAPLTIIFGANSAGKSSLGHLLLALKQTILSTDRRRALHLGDKNTLIDLGTYTECLHDHNLEASLNFELSWLLPRILEIKDRLHFKRYRGDYLDLSVSLRTGKNNQPETYRLEYVMKEKDVPRLDVSFVKQTSGEFDLHSRSYNFVRTPGRVWPLDQPEKFYRISDQSRAKYQNADFLLDFALATEHVLENIYYLGPLREYPQRTYQWSGETPEHVGFKGESAIAAILAAQGQERQLNRGPKQKNLMFAEFIASWLKDIGIIHSFVVKAVAEGRKEYEVLVKTHAHASEVKLPDVGFGISQVLPALVEAFYCPPGSVVWMEQPEIHLHPQVQSELADVFISAIKSRENGSDRNIQLIIESHSEHFLNRLQLRIAQGRLTPDDVAIYFCKRSGKAAQLETLEVNPYGDIKNWPENFFGDEMKDLTERTAAAMERRQEEQTQ